MPIPITGCARLAVSTVVLLAALSSLTTSWVIHKFFRVADKTNLSAELAVARLLAWPVAIFPLPIQHAGGFC
ncbi:hypothetical protein PD5205_00073 [Xanthomonas fragariae]|uniref:Uncharacterized protein n=1 Tax=Xanthomonas fragariae TaxID=48664 RepID=A0A1Y6H1G5_9XANT|nr:hypothetical protein PD885_00073 [Xanthomonas fragariae]SMR01397.1 hypothetical protein PD5205_00073 [Xanthomonas fragariae]